jgi:predicted Fe-Mo cluster-binding NifX family protein
MPGGRILTDELYDWRLETFSGHGLEVRNMATRVAVASKDGVMVHQHFGRATHFQIYALEEDGFRFIETRENRPSCDPDNYERETESHERVVRLLADCRIVLVARIGLGAREVLEAHGLEAFEIPTFIDDALHRIIAETKQKTI